MSDSAKNNKLLDEKDGYELRRISYDGGKVEFIISKEGPLPEFHRLETYKAAEPFWKTVHTRANNGERNRHFKTIEARVKEIEKKENDKQMPLLGDGEEEDAA